MVTALDRTWHPEHFFCAQCGAFFGPEGTDQQTHSPQECRGGRGFADVRVREESTSGGPNSTPKPHSSGFHEKDGKAYCRKDYFDMFAPKCGGCARAILENYISALNTLWHPECFVCRVRSPLPPRLEGTGSGHRGEKSLPLSAPWIQLGGFILGY